MAELNSTLLVDRNGVYRFGYDATEDKNRRQPPRVSLRTEDQELDSPKRRKLTSTGRDVIRNYTVAAWMIRKHLDWVSTFSFQSRNGDKVLDQQIEDFVKWWSRPRNFDVAGRHSRQRFLRLAEARRTIDGDVGILKLSSGLAQGIEGDRIRTPLHKPTLNNVLADFESLVHGIRLSKAGRARAYALHNRTGLAGGFTFARWVPARHMLLHGYFDRIDQIRGVGLIASGLNSLQDTYEGLDYALAKAKISQLFGLKYKSNPDEPGRGGDVTTTATSTGQLDSSATTVDYGRGPRVFYLDAGADEDVEFLESKTPPQEFRQFMLTLIMVALKSVDIPYCFFDEAHTNYAGNRQAALLYEQSATAKRGDNIELQDSLLAWRLSVAIRSGRLELPGKVTLADLRWEWIPQNLPWYVNPLVEVKADTEAVAGRIASRQRVSKRHNLDWWEIADELAAEEKFLRANNILPVKPSTKGAPQ